MARAIAHEIKNPLTPIQLSNDHLRRMLTDKGILPDESIDACLTTVAKQVRALQEIAGEFSTYARLPDLDPKPVDPTALMRSAIGPYRTSPPPGVDISQEFEETGSHRRRRQGAAPGSHQSDRKCAPRDA